MRGSGSNRSACLTAFIAVAYGTYLVIRTIFSGVDIPGYASLMVAVLFLGGLQLMVLGVIGEYLGRSYSEAKNRPLYVVRDSLGFEATNMHDPRIADKALTVQRRRSKANNP